MEDIDGGPVRLPNEFYYMTCHRQENTDTDEKLDQILQAMDALDAPVVYPVHPRNCGRVDRLRLEKGYRNTLLVAPVGYRCSVFLVNRAKKIITDSGGLQREAFFAGRPCVTVFDRAIWPETMVNHCNQLARPNKEDILSKLEAVPFFDFKYRPFGDGHSAEKITEAITNFLA